MGDFTEKCEKKKKVQSNCKSLRILTKLLDI